MKRERADFMNLKQINDMEGFSRTHENCKELTGVYRPGKTAKDRWLKSNKNY